MEKGALCLTWTRQTHLSALGAVCCPTTLLFGVLLFCRLSTGEAPKSEVAVPAKLETVGSKAVPPKQWGAGGFWADFSSVQGRGSADGPEGLTTWVSEEKGVEGLGNGERMSTSTKARHHQGSQNTPAWEDATPCPASCACTSTAVNCSRAGLVQVPSGQPWSWKVTALDLSHNYLSRIQAEELAAYPNLQLLDLSANRIRTIEEGAFRLLGRLQTLKLGSNSFACNCSLRWLAGWVRERGELVGDVELLQCFQPASFSTSRLLSADFSALTCAADFISCVQDAERMKDTVLQYSSLHLGHHTRASCHVLCYQEEHTHYSLDGADRCLCGSLSEEAATDCRKVCSNEIQSQVCNKTIIHAVYPVQVSLSFSARPYYSLHEMIEFTAEVPLPGTVYTWDFGDRGEQYITSRTRAQHLYALPGMYVVTVKAQTGQRSLLRQVGVSVILPVALVGLECPTVVGTGERADIWIRVPRGTDLSVFWRVMIPSGQEILGERLRGVISAGSWFSCEMGSFHERRQHWSIGGRAAGVAPLPFLPPSFLPRDCPGEKRMVREREEPGWHVGADVKVDRP